MPKKQPPVLRKVLLPLLIVVLSGSFSLAAAVPEEKPASPETSVEKTPEKDAETRGIASYYAKRYNGRKTNSGQRYDPVKLTAAHPDLPHGTKVHVRNLDNGREVVVTVNDRCRKRKFPFIDLSREAARRLGFLGKGITRVVITPFGKKKVAAEELKQREGGERG
jgi:rare lipoprotein A